MSAAPTGVISLVFTDVQGSTVLWDRAPQAMRAALATHDQVMRHSLVAAGGYEVKTEGDAFMVAFASPGAAVSWCLGAQEALKNAPWPEDILAHDEACEVHEAAAEPLQRGLRVRMGVHTGEPLCQTDPVTGRMDYFGGMVNRAARIGAAGHGGQVLISEATWRGIGSACQGAVITDLGEHALAGLERREHLRQILPESLAQRRFARLRTPDLKKTNLPRRVDTFVGRKDETKAIAQRFEDGVRLVTVLGAGGTGKTRISQRVAATVLAKYPGGSWFVDLSEARSLPGILSAFGQALEVALTDADPVAQMGEALKARGRLLVVVDNVEQVVDHVAQTVGRWLQHAPEVHFLATSRIRLDLEGEQIFYLDPLPQAEAIQLFEDRAAAVKPGFSIDDANRKVIAEIVDRLDRVSLAIELAAARVRMLAPEKILERLSQRFKLLQGKRRDQSERQTTLRGAIDWSWELLKPWEQLALAQCSVFDGGFSLEAAEAVLELSAWPDAPWPMDVVETLVDHSLLRHHGDEGEERFTLFRSIQEYAEEKHSAVGAVVAPGGAPVTGPEEQQRTQRRHGDHYGRMGSPADDGVAIQPTDSDLRRGTLELENLHGAVRRGLAQGWGAIAARCCTAIVLVAERLGPHRESLALAERVLKLPNLPDQDRLFLLLKCCPLWAMMGQMEPARANFDAARALPSTPDDLLRLWFKLTEVIVVHREGDTDAAWARTQEALVIAERLQRPLYRGICLASLGIQSCQVGDLVLSASLLEQAVELLTQEGATLVAMNAKSNLALLDFILGRLDASEAAYKSLAAQQLAGGNSVDHGVTIVNLGLINCVLGAHEQALHYFDEAISLAKRVDSTWIEVWAMAWKGRVYHALGRRGEALILIEAALRSFERVGDLAGRVYALLFLAALKRDEGELAAAVDSIDQAYLLCADLADPVLRAFTAAVDGTVRLELGDRDLALRRLAEAQEMARQKGMLPGSDLAQQIAALSDCLGRQGAASDGSL